MDTSSMTVSSPASALSFRELVMFLGFFVASHHPNVGPFLLILAIHGLEIQSVSAHPMIETSTLAL